VCAASSIGRVGIFHLIRAANGLEVFRTFVDSIRAAPPTCAWTLELILKGFPNTDATGPYLALAKGLPVHTCSIDDSGFDISSYFTAVRRTAHDTAMFFNSFCELVEPRWFEIFATAFAPTTVGLVGATGSLESVVRNHLIYGGTSRSLALRAKNYALSAGLAVVFPPFPNAHVRTNAFMIKRDAFLSTHAPGIKTRFGALVYESGWTSLTRQIRARGLATLIVDRQGRSFEPDQWGASRTFRSGHQENVVVRDNRITEYETATAERQELLRWLAFGDQSLS